jgi:hypothetical protein
MSSCSLFGGGSENDFRQHIPIQIQPARTSLSVARRCSYLSLSSSISLSASSSCCRLVCHHETADSSSSSSKGGVSDSVITGIARNQFASLDWTLYGCLPQVTGRYKANLGPSSLLRNVVGTKALLLA